MQQQSRANPLWIGLALLLACGGSGGGGSGPADASPTDAPVDARDAEDLDSAPTDGSVANDGQVDAVLDTGSEPDCAGAVDGAGCSSSGAQCTSQCPAPYAAYSYSCDCMASTWSCTACPG